jgi:hypothetical protein
MNKIRKLKIIITITIIQERLCVAKFYWNHVSIHSSYTTRWLNSSPSLAVIVNNYSAISIISKPVIESIKWQGSNRILSYRSLWPNWWLHNIWLFRNRCWCCRWAAHLCCRGRCCWCCWCVGVVFISLMSYTMSQIFQFFLIHYA